MILIYSNHQIALGWYLNVREELCLRIQTPTCLMCICNYISALSFSASDLGAWELRGGDLWAVPGGGREAALQEETFP